MTVPEAPRPPHTSSPTAVASRQAAVTGLAPVGASAPVSRGTITAWALWDWGAAAFNAVVITFVFAPYLTSAVASDPDSGSEALGIATGLAGLAIALLAPAAGIRADTSGRHKLWLGVNTGLVVVAMAGMFFVRDDPGYLLPGLLLVAIGSVFFELAEVSYNGMLTRISTSDTAGRISGLGWGLGYFGGLVLLVLLLVTVIQPEVGLFGASDEGGLRYRIVALAAAVWFALFALPVLLFGPTDTAPSARRKRTVGQMFRAVIAGWIDGYKRVWSRIVELFRTDRNTFWFFLASAIFRDGLATIFAFAGVIAAGSYGFSGSEVIVLGVAANVVAGIGSVVAGWFDDRFGPKAVITVGLVCLVLGALPIAFNDSKTVFWAAAMWLCLFVGPVQSASRAFLTRITPAERAGENFGLYATTGRAVSFIGPFMFTTFIAVFGFQRAGALGIALVLLVGLAVFVFVKSPLRSKPGILSD